MAEDFDLSEAVKKKFKHLSTPALIQRMENAEDFKYDDEEIELNRRLKLKGKHYKWSESLSSPKIIVYDEVVK